MTTTTTEQESNMNTCTATRVRKGSKHVIVVSVPGHDDIIVGAARATSSNYVVVSCSLRFAGPLREDGTREFGSERPPEVVATRADLKAAESELARWLRWAGTVWAELLTVDEEV